LQLSSPTLLDATTQTPFSSSLVTLAIVRVKHLFPSDSSLYFDESFTYFRPMFHRTDGFGHPDIWTVIENGSSSFMRTGCTSAELLINGALLPWASSRVVLDMVIKNRTKVCAYLKYDETSFSTSILSSVICKAKNV